MAKRGLVQEQLAAMPLRVPHWGKPSDETTLGAWFLATRRELISASKLCATLRKHLQAEPDRQKRLLMRGHYAPQISLLQRELYSARQMTWCGDRMVFAWSWGWAVPKAAKTVAKVYELAARLGVAQGDTMAEKPAGEGQSGVPPVFAGAIRVSKGQAVVMARKQDGQPRRDPYECECDNCQGCAGEW